MCCLAVLQAGRPGSGCGQLCFPLRPLSSAYSWLPFPCGLSALSSLRASPLMFLWVLNASSHKHSCQTGLGPSLTLTQLPVQRSCLQVQLPSDVWSVESLNLRIRRQTGLSPPQGILQDWESPPLAKRGVCHLASQVTRLCSLKSLWMLSLLQAWPVSSGFVSPAESLLSFSCLIPHLSHLVLFLAALSPVFEP